MRNDRRISWFVLAGIFVAAQGCQAQGAARESSRVCFGKACFSVEVVRSEEDKAKGLMFRKGLEEGRGMFFVFDREDIYPFWMKNMTFPIDILWLDRDKKVVHIEANVPPCAMESCTVYTPSAKAMFVLELSAGAVAQNGIHLGD